jgi:uncharacterized protein YerC
MKNINDLQAGKAGEYLVCADLILKGFIAYPTEQGLPYDVILDVSGKLYKVQVKTTRKPSPVPQRKNRTEKYIVNIRRCGKGGRRSYKKGEVDIFAVVALDTRTIGYIKAENTKQTMFFLPEGKKYKTDEKTDKKYQQVIELRKQGKTYTEISEITGIDRALANRIVLGKRGHNRNKFDEYNYKGKYLSDYKIEDCI